MNLTKTYFDHKGKTRSSQRVAWYTTNKNLDHKGKTRGSQRVAWYTANRDLDHKGKTRVLQKFSVELTKDRPYQRHKHGH